MNKKRIIKIIGIILITALVISNIYWGWKYVERKIYERAFNEVINAILIQVQNAGEVLINTNEGQIRLVPQQ